MNQDPPSSGECDPLCSVDETSSQEFAATYQPKTDFVKALAIFAAAATGTVAINQSWVAANQVYYLLTCFIICEAFSCGLHKWI